MKRDLIISVAAIAHGVLFLFTGISALIVPTGLDPAADVSSGHGHVRAIGGVLVVIATGLLWSVLRGVIDVPMRFVVAATSGLCAGGIFTGVYADAGTIAFVIAGAHLLFTIGWIGILITSDSPYRPRPVASAKREHQRTSS